MPRALIIEDDETTAHEIEAALQDHAFRTAIAASSEAALRCAQQNHFDVITLDRLLPGTDGLTVLQNLRESGVTAPVLVISALGDVDERIAGLRAGGDDYLAKPFSPEEMIVRVETLLRRAAPAPAEDVNVLRLRDLEIDLLTRTVRRADRIMDLLPREYRLLEFMVRNPGAVLSRRMIFEHVWNYDFDPGANLINVHVARLRKKLESPGTAPLISTVRGEGYRLEIDD